MNAGELLRRGAELAAGARPRVVAVAGWVWRNREAVLVVAAILLVLLVGRAWRHVDELQGQLDAAARRGAGEARAAAAQVPTVQVVPQAVVDEEGERAKREVPVLRKELERATKALGKVRLELVARIKTEAAPATAPPRPAQPAGEEPRPALLLAGDKLRLEADLVGGRSEDGARLAVGTLSAYRVLDGEALAVQAFSQPLTFAVESGPAAACQTQQDRPWRVGAVGGYSGQGWVAGPAYTRRWEVWRVKPEGFIAGAGGPGGVVLLAGALF